MNHSKITALKNCELGLLYNFRMNNIVRRSQTLKHESLFSLLNYLGLIFSQQFAVFSIFWWDASFWDLYLRGSIVYAVPYRIVLNSNSRGNAVALSKSPYHCLALHPTMHSSVWGNYNLLVIGNIVIFCFNQTFLSQGLSISFSLCKLTWYFRWAGQIEYGHLWLREKFPVLWWGNRWTLRNVGGRWKWDESGLSLQMLQVQIPRAVAVESGRKKVVDCWILMKTDFSVRARLLLGPSSSNVVEYLRVQWHIGHFAQRVVTCLTARIYPASETAHRPNECHWWLGGCPGCTRDARSSWRARRACVPCAGTRGAPCNELW